MNKIPAPPLLTATFISATIARLFGYTPQEFLATPGLLIGNWIFRGIGSGRGFDVRSLVDQLSQSFTATGRRVRFRVEVTPVQFPIETALPSGMILVELITNILKYAYPDGRSGEALVRLAVAEGRVNLTVADDGVGLPADFDISKARSFGWQLIRNLSTQLDALTTIDQEGGARVTVSFPFENPNA